MFYYYSTGVSVSAPLNAFTNFNSLPPIKDLRAYHFYAPTGFTDLPIWAHTPRPFPHFPVLAKLWHIPISPPLQRPHQPQTRVKAPISNKYNPRGRRPLYRDPPPVDAVFGSVLRGSPPSALFKPTTEKLTRTPVGPKGYLRRKTTPDVGLAKPLK